MHEVRQVPLGRLHEDLVLAVASGEAPDLALLDSIWVAEFSRHGFLLPLDPIDRDWIERELKPEFAPSFVEAQAPADGGAGSADQPEVSV